MAHANTTPSAPITQLLPQDVALAIANSVRSGRRACDAIRANDAISPTRAEALCLHILRDVRRYVVELAGVLDVEVDADDRDVTYCGASLPSDPLRLRSFFWHNAR